MNKISKEANDPSEGSPTETLLRLFLPLGTKIWTEPYKTSTDEDIKDVQFSPIFQKIFILDLILKNTAEIIGSLHKNLYQTFLRLLPLL